MARTDADIKTILRTSGPLGTTELDELEVWLKEQCPLSVQIPFNRDYLSAYRNDHDRVVREGNVVWVGFCDDNEAMLFKLSWC